MDPFLFSLLYKSVDCAWVGSVWDGPMLRTQHLSTEAEMVSQGRTFATCLAQIKLSKDSSGLASFLGS